MDCNTNVENNLDNENINEIFKYWNREEIKSYYDLILQKIDVRKIDDQDHTTKDDMWQQSTYKPIFEEVEDILKQRGTMEDLHQQMKKLKFEDYNKKKKLKQFEG